RHAPAAGPRGQPRGETGGALPRRADHRPRPPRQDGDVGADPGAVQDGTTLLLTTQYMDEADQLADKITVIDGGLVIAEGTADQLKSRVGGDLVEFRVLDRSDLEAAARTAEGVGVGSATADPDTGRIVVPVGGDGSSART